MKIKKQDKKVTKFPQLTDEQWDNLHSYMLYGTPTKDSKGHSSYINFRVQPGQIDKIEAIQEKFPYWWKSKGELYRAMAAVGCFAMLCMVEQEIDVIEEKQILYMLNQISRKQKFDDIRSQFKAHRKDVLMSDQNDETKMLLMKTLNKVERLLFEKLP